ncbi:MAG: Transposase [Ignavibacteria bacterium]|nr:Transposase [Ignavibacteria bacterium]
MKARNKNYMWYKVKELSDNGFNKSQISYEVGIDRGTVYKYLSMDEQSYQEWIKNPSHVSHKLFPYIKFIKAELVQYPYLSAAQIEDRLKEHFSELPDIHSKTVYNFVQLVRKKYNIEKPGTDEFRQCEKLPELAYGKQAQVDFGEGYMLTNQEKRIKVYFFCMVLSRSRYKFVYIQNQCFTTKTAVYAHELAFEYFEGVPKEILYDQDTVFLHDENLGDYLLTHDFQAFCKTQSFKTIFCHKADPQSKGKIESVVKFVKYNFLRGRIYIDIDSLNQSAKEWLIRTGNGKKHSTTHKVPSQEWEIEKRHLLPLKSKALAPISSWQRYNVRKDNTVAYRSNFYSLPLGTYQGTDTKIFLEVIETQLNLYAEDKRLLASHQLSVNKGELVRNTDHGRNKSVTIEQTHNEVFDLLGKTERALLFLQLLKTDKPRYYHDNLRALKQGLVGVSKEIIDKTIEICIESKTYNGYVFCEIVNKYLQQQQKQETPKIPIQLSVNKIKTDWPQMPITPQTSNINTYEKLF